MLNRSTHISETSFLRGNIPIHHRYTLGIAGERFFRAMRDEKVLLASQCAECGLSTLPPKIYCEACFGRTEDWRPAQGLPNLITFTVVHFDLDGGVLEEPQYVGMVGWEGIAGGLIHRIGEVRETDIKPGLKLEAVWAERRTGSMEDIQYFRPHAIFPSL